MRARRSFKLTCCDEEEMQMGIKIQYGAKPVASSSKCWFDHSRVGTVVVLILSAPRTVFAPTNTS